MASLNTSDQVQTRHQVQSSDAIYVLNPLQLYWSKTIACHLLQGNFSPIPSNIDVWLGS